MASGERVRLDRHLVDNGIYADSDAALRALIAGEVLVNDAVATSVAQLVSEADDIRVRQRRRYVSRGGTKLEGALREFHLDARDARCLDIGASTGGFTDCLLQHGAAFVSCVDVNYGQLDWRIRDDDRVEVHERTNIKDVIPEEVGYPFDIIAIDVSFIGLSSLAPVLASLSREGTTLVALVKPQFESKRGEAPNGVVQDESIRVRTVEEVRSSLVAVGFAVDGIIESPIKGPAGNVEYLLLATFGG